MTAENIRGSIISCGCGVCASMRPRPMTAENPRKESVKVTTHATLQ